MLCGNNCCKSVSLQNTVSCDNSTNSASKKYTVSWFCLKFQFYSCNILKLQMFPRYPKSTFPMCITSSNVHYIFQFTLHLPMYITVLYVTSSHRVSKSMAFVFVGVKTHFNWTHLDRHSTSSSWSLQNLITFCLCKHLQYPSVVTNFFA